MITSTASDLMQRARSAQGAWAQAPMRSRIATLKRLRMACAARREEIVETIARETGKPALDALAGDLLVSLEQMRYYEIHASRILIARRIGKPAFIYAGTRFTERFEPHGVVLVFGASNYPFQLSVVPMITALYAGNAVIVKCSEKTPDVARLIASLCDEAALPADLVQVVNDGPEIAAAYIDAGPDMIFFTGSSEHGRMVARRAAELLIPAVMELGGKDAALVFADCNLERTIQGVLYGAFSNAGQVCVGTKRVYVEQAIYAPFLEQFTRAAQELRIGHGSDVDFGPLAGESAQSRLRDQVMDALQHGAQLHGLHDGVVRGDAPVILSNVNSQARLLVEETFGPVVCIAPFQTEEEAVTLANSSPFQLSASVWTGDIARGERVAVKLGVGSCAVNDVIRNIGNPHASFGGNRQSGFGRYHGAQGLYAFSRTKSVMVTGDKGRREIHWFPFSKATFSKLALLMDMRHRKGGLMGAIRRFLSMALLCAIIPAAVAAAQDANQQHLWITVTNAIASHGPVAYLIFASPDGFPNQKTKAAKGGFAQLSGSSVTFDAGAFPPGRYAVSVYQDLNGNHKLDTGLFGIPKEPVGASNNPHTSMGPPHFDQCAFEIGQADEKISIALVHAR